MRTHSQARALPGKRPMKTSESRQIQIDRLNLRVEVAGRLALFAHKGARCLEAAERHLRLGPRRLPVHMYDPGFYPLHELQRLADVAGADRCGKAKFYL